METEASGTLAVVVIVVEEEVAMVTREAGNASDKQYGTLPVAAAAAGECDRRAAPDTAAAGEISFAGAMSSAC